MACPAEQFNPKYYVAAYPDLLAAYGSNYDQAIVHYRSYGIREGRSPNPFFIPRYYLDRYPDLTAAYGTNYSEALDHWLAYGINEGRRGSPILDPRHYQVELENDQVRVLRINYGAHEKSVMHSHPDGVAIFQNDIHCSFALPDGRTEEHRFRAGEVLYMPAGAHLPTNLSDQPLNVILVELKR